MGAGKAHSKVCAVPSLVSVPKNEDFDPLNTSDCVKLYKPPHLSERIPAQQGLFTLHGRPTESWQPANMREIVIDKSACGKIKDRLNACAINRATLFPGLDGLSDNLRWRYKWQRPL